MDNFGGSYRYLDVDAYRSSAWDSYGNFSGSASYSWNAPVQTSLGQEMGGNSGMTQADASRSMGEGLKSMPSFNSFVSGMKLGYQGAMDTFAPFLSYRAAKQQKAILGMQAELYDMQAQSYQTAADDAVRAGLQQQAAVSFQLGQQKSSARTSMAARGVHVGAQGSSAEVLTNYDISKEIQVNQIMANAVATSFGYRRSAVKASNQALAARSTQKSISPWAAALTTVLQTAINASSSMGSMSQSQGGGGKSPSGAGGLLNSDMWSNFGSLFSSGAASGADAGGGMGGGGG